MGLGLGSIRDVGWTILARYCLPGYTVSQGQCEETEEFS